MDGAELGGSGVEKHQSKNRGFASHRVARVDFNFAAAADDYDAAIRRDGFEVFAEVDVGKHFENHVGSAALGEFPKFSEVVGRAVIQDLIGAFAQGERATFIRS